MKHLLTQWQMAVKWSIALFASLCCLLFWGCKQAFSDAIGAYE